MKKRMQFIELPGLPQQITKKGEYLSIAKDYFGCKGKWVVVTGAASGMGDAATKMLAELGAEIYALDVREVTEPVNWWGLVAHTGEIACG